MDDDKSAKLAPCTPDQIAAEWIVHLSSGKVTDLDGDALRTWCRDDPLHAEAFVQAKIRWEKLAIAGRRYAARRELIASAPSRRVALFGTLSAASLGAAYLALRPPLKLWPSIADLTADYRTNAGQRQTIKIASGVTAELNLKSSMKISADRSNTIRLVSGEIAVDADATDTVTVEAGPGQVAFAQASITVRQLPRGFRIACLRGKAAITYRDRVVALSERKQLCYDDQRAGAVEAIDPEIANAWRRGMIVLHDARLDQVIEEINRYRPGRVILMNQTLAQQHLELAGVRIDELDAFVRQIAKAYDADLRELPGNILILT